jgi:hypothetical protein
VSETQYDPLKNIHEVERSEEKVDVEKMIYDTGKAGFER